ncbi:head-tail adaptor [Paracoccus halophilus]|uniref:Head-tail adaptor n=1 Tax=Paracoccus halophilus TaxID=376733 RepID=A0A099F2Y5_9RHOB|nr:head-tail adaptor protein [Paracoccus halophilus]KGJ04814.1 tail protein [Paracoccus halophilus]SFA51329.1 head-tail adaptor [Paracoccus halophilus]
MSTPRLTVPLTIESPVREADGMGGYELRWRDIGKIWAEMRSGAGGERFAEVGAQSVVTWRITVRAAPAGDPRRPRPEQRLRMGEGADARRFKIEAVAEKDAGGRWLVCVAKEESLA